MLYIIYLYTSNQETELAVSTKCHDPAAHQLTDRSSEDKALVSGQITTLHTVSMEISSSLSKLAATLSKQIVYLI